MALGRATIAPISYGDATLPRINITPAPLVPGSLVNFSTHGLTPGTSVAPWYDSVQGAMFAGTGIASQNPVVNSTGGKTFLKFDGSNDRLDLTVDLSQPVTLAIVARMPAIAPSTYMITGGTGPSFNLGVNSTSDKWILFAGTGLTSAQAPNTNWHVFVIVVNGENSIFNLDGTENTGNVGTNAANTLRLGASGSAYYGAEFMHLSVAPFAASTSQRANMVSQLKAAYGV